MSWFQVFLVIGFIAVFGGSFIAAMLLWIGEWDVDMRFLWAIAVTLVHVMCWAFLIKGLADDDNSQREECEMAGGYWVQTGSRPVLVGKVIITQPVYGCSLR